MTESMKYEFENYQIEIIDGNWIGFHIYEADPNEGDNEIVEGTFNWRGCWECRLYFKDSEYFIETFVQIYNMIVQFIEPKCKEILRKRETNSYVHQMMDEDHNRHQFNVKDIEEVPQ